METEPQTTSARDQDLEPARRRRLRHRRTPRPGEGLLVPHRSRLQEPRRLHQPQARLLPTRPRHGPPDPMGHRRGELVLLLAALAGIARPPASASANPVLVHITRTVTGESALLDLDPSQPGVDARATQSLRELMRDTTTGRSVSPTPELFASPRRARSGVSRQNHLDRPRLRGPSKNLHVNKPRAGKGARPSHRQRRLHRHRALPRRTSSTPRTGRVLPECDVLPRGCRSKPWDLV